MGTHPCSHAVATNCRRTRAESDSVETNSTLVDAGNESPCSRGIGAVFWKSGAENLFFVVHARKLRRQTCQRDQRRPWLFELHHQSKIADLLRQIKRMSNELVWSARHKTSGLWQDAKGAAERERRRDAGQGRYQDDAERYRGQCGRESHAGQAQQGEYQARTDKSCEPGEKARRPGDGHATSNEEYELHAQEDARHQRRNDPKNDLRAGFGWKACEQPYTA